jgi:hypothetical protein
MHVHTDNLNIIGKVLYTLKATNLPLNRINHGAPQLNVWIINQSYIQSSSFPGSSILWRIFDWHQRSTVYISGTRTSVIRPIGKVKPRRRPLTSNSSEGRKQFLYHFSQLNLVFSNNWTVWLIKFSVHKIIILVFKSKSKYEISAHSLPRWRKLKCYRTSVPVPFYCFCLRG